MTVIGHGDIARAIPAHLAERPGWTWFASGVSDSSETRMDAFRRERALLQAQPQDAHLVYFSSLCVFYADTAYARHKSLMEMAVKRYFARYTLVRLGAITWGANPHLLINHLRAQHAAGVPLDVRDTRRVVHTLADFHYALEQIPDWSCEIAAPGRLLTVRQIVNEYVIGMREPA